MYRIDVLVQGFPGKAVCHGGLGWSTIALLRSDHRNILIDVGAFGIRKPLESQLKAIGIAPDDITDVVLTHAHYDHSINFVLFDRATVWIGAKEIAWAAAQPPGFDPLPELYVQALATDPRVKRVHEGEEFLPGIVAFDAPGHTPGSLVFHLTANDSAGDLHRRRRQEPCRTDLAQGRHEPRRGREHEFDRPDLGAVAGGAGDDRHSRARSQHAAG